MAALTIRVLLVLSLLSVPFALVAGYRAASSPPRPTVEVVIEGVVVRGDTYQVEPVGDETALARPGDQILGATVQVINRDGHQVSAEADDRGRFRVGPILLRGDDEDVITISCPTSRALCMSALLPAEALTESGAAPVVVRWRISLPPEAGGDSEAPPTVFPETASQG